MLRNVIILVSCLIATTIHGQTVEDTKDFLKENIMLNSPMKNYDNIVLFEDDVLKVHAEQLAGKQLTASEYSNIFIFGQDVYLNDRSGSAFSIAQVIDIRDISKVTTVRAYGQYPHYVISLYLRNNFHSTEYSKVLGEIERKSILKMDILVSDDKN